MASAKFEIDWRVVNRIAAHDQQHVDFAGIHVADQFFHRSRLVLRLHLHRIRCRSTVLPLAPSA